jgi:hypothetical protein
LLRHSDQTSGVRGETFKGNRRQWQALAYVDGHADKRDAEIAKGLTLDEARRIASNIAKLPALLKGHGRHREILASVNPRSPSIPSK